MAKTISGKQAVKILTRNFGFEVVGRKGSHVKLRKIEEGAKITTIVPDHKELARGTLKSALKLAKVSERDFWDYA